MQVRINERIIKDNKVRLTKLQRIKMSSKYEDFKEIVEIVGSVIGMTSFLILMYLSMLLILS